MKQKEVLIIDDDYGVQEAYKLIFDRAGYKTEVLSSAKAVLDRTAAVPDIYILDQQLSGVTGLEVCKFIKNLPEEEQRPVIIISASPNVRRLAETACADNFLEKPFKQKELLGMVENLVADQAT